MIEKRSTQLELTSFDHLKHDGLKEREQFSVTLRKKKNQDYLQSKRKALMLNAQQRIDQSSSHPEN